MTLSEFVLERLFPTETVRTTSTPEYAMVNSQIGTLGLLATGMTLRTPVVFIEKLKLVFEYSSGNRVSRVDVAEALLSCGFQLVPFGNKVAVLADWKRKPVLL